MCALIRKTNSLLWCEEKIAVYSTNHIEHIIKCAGKIQSFLVLKPLEHE